MNNNPEVLNKIIECKDKTAQLILRLNELPKEGTLAADFGKIHEYQNLCLSLIQQNINSFDNPQLRDALDQTANRIVADQQILSALLTPKSTQKATATEISSLFFINKMVKKQEVDSWISYEKAVQESQSASSASAGSFDLLYFVLIFIALVGVSRFVRKGLLKKEEDK